MSVNPDRVLRLRASSAIRRMERELGHYDAWRSAHQRFLSCLTWKRDHAGTDERIAAHGGDVIAAHRAWRAEVEKEIAPRVATVKARIAKVERLAALARSTR